MNKTTFFRDLLKILRNKFENLSQIIKAMWRNQLQIGVPAG